MIGEVSRRHEYIVGSKDDLQIETSGDMKNLINEIMASSPIQGRNYIVTT